MLVSFTYEKNARTVTMQKRFAEILQKLGHGYYTENAEAFSKPVVNTPPPLEVKEPVSEVKEPAAPQETEQGEAKTFHVSVAAKKIADDFKVDLSLVTGTGANGQITKTDVESYIDSRV